MDDLALLFIEQPPPINFNLIGDVINELGQPMNVAIEEDRRNIPKNEHFYENTIPLYMDDLFKEHFRMSRRAVAELNRIIGNDKPMLRRGKIDLQKKILFTIWVIAKPESFLAVGDRFGMARSTAHYVFRQIIGALEDLMPQFINWPLNSNAIEENFRQRTGLPGVIGAIDGCHIEIKQPAHNTHDYFNRNNYHSIILQGICDHTLKFIDIFVGMPGRVHDARVFRNSPVFETIRRLPPNRHILADSAYPLMMNVMCPYRDNGHLNVEQINFNTILSRARAVIERTFGRLKGKFRRLKYLDIYDPNFGSSIITAACVLHNFVITEDGADDEEYEPEPGFENIANGNIMDFEDRNVAIAKRNDLAYNLNN